MKKKQIITFILCVIFFVLIISCATNLDQPHRLPETNIQGADYMGWETCEMCHEKVVADFWHSDHGRLRFSEDGERPQDLVCEACHGPASLHVEAGGGQGIFIINPGKDPEVCFQCHTSIQARLRLQYHHPVHEGILSCTNCHNLHSGNIFSIKGMFVARRNAVCMQCHRDQGRPRVFEHEALREGCMTCHHTHGSINDKMLIERDSNLCLKCHGQLESPGAIMIGDFSHTTRLMQGTCWSAGCHTAVHGSNINPHLRY